LIIGLLKKKTLFAREESRTPRPEDLQKRKESVKGGAEREEKNGKGVRKGTIDAE